MDTSSVGIGQTQLQRLRWMGPGECCETRQRGPAGHAHSQHDLTDSFGVPA
jgi:hypothetical protein